MLTGVREDGFLSSVKSTNLRSRVYSGSEDFDLKAVFRIFFSSPKKASRARSRFSPVNSFKLLALKEYLRT